jgi:hypothetical protein
VAASASELLQGALGHFWVNDGIRVGALTDEASNPGYVSFDDLGRIAVEMLEEPDPAFLIPRALVRYPRAVLGFTNATTFLGLNAVGYRRRGSSGQRTSTLTYRFWTAVTGADLTELKSARIFAVSAFFPVTESWSGVTALTATSKYDRKGYPKEISLKLRAPQAIGSPLSGARSLHVGAHWEVNRNQRARPAIFAPLEIRVESRRPTDSNRLIVPLIAMQDLISVALKGYVAAEGGTVQLDEDLTRRRHAAARFWDWRLMHPAEGARRSELGDAVLFTLDDIGGATHLRRWIDLWTSQPRVVQPVVAPVRTGRRPAPEALRDVAGAIELYVNAAKGTEWAKPQRDEAQAHALARKAGPAFAEWVGDPMRWAKALRDTNNLLKHQPRLVLDYEHIADLHASGRYLLLCVLLARVSGSRSVIERSSTTTGLMRSALDFEKSTVKGALEMSALAALRPSAIAAVRPSGSGSRVSLRATSALLERA